jgi:hypothetical protein
MIWHFPTYGLDALILKYCFLIFLLIKILKFIVFLTFAYHFDIIFRLLYLIFVLLGCDSHGLQHELQLIVIDWAVVAMLKNDRWEEVVIDSRFIHVHDYDVIRLARVAVL